MNLLKYCFKRRSNAKCQIIYQNLFSNIIFLSYDLGSEAGLDSPGAIAGCEEYFRNLPYGVNVDPRSSGASDSFTKSRNSQESLSFRTRRLPDKLRIVKPLEGSLTLHNWSRYNSLFCFLAPSGAQGETISVPLSVYPSLRL